MPGFIDLHSHCIPGVDDGVRNVEEGIELCRGLFLIGFTRVVATPHIRTAMFENRKEQLQADHRRFLDAVAGMPQMPEIELGAEYFWDDVFWELFHKGEALLYPGQKAVLVEFPIGQIPVGIEQGFFRMNVRGVRPVLAHPERYYPLERSSKPIERALQSGAVALLNIAALTGKYGTGPQRAAERMLEEGIYYAAGTDSHRLEDVESVQWSIDRMRSLAGESEVTRMLAENPLRILEGRVENE